MTKARPLETLRQARIRNPLRVVNLIRDTIEYLDLDLSGLTVLTEAACGPYVVTPVIAALSGAHRVVALTRDSRYGSVQEVIRQTRALESLCGLERRVDIHSGRPTALFREADVVTNLGFVRPIDATVIKELKKDAVVTLMCEAWEARAEDVDVSACLASGVSIVGVNETDRSLPIMQYCASLALKMILECQVEAFRSRIGVVSADRMGAIISEDLASRGLSIDVLPNLREAPYRDRLAALDALVVADCSRAESVIGSDGDITATEVAKTNPTLAIVPLAGKTDVVALQAAGLTVYPTRQTEARRMTMTLAELGPRPVVELHAAGLKTAEMERSMRLQEHPPQMSPFLGLMQRVTADRVDQDLTRTTS